MGVVLQDDALRYPDRSSPDLSGPRPCNDMVYHIRISQTSLLNSIGANPGPTRHITLMTVTSFALGALGFTLVLAPEFVLASVIPGADRVLLPVLQLLGGSLAGFGYLNWMSRRAILGGALGRPIIISNLAHGLVGTGVLLRVLAAQEGFPMAWTICGVYIVYTVAFGRLLFVRPRALQNPSAL